MRTSGAAIQMYMLPIPEAADDFNASFWADLRGGCKLCFCAVVLPDGQPVLPAQGGAPMALPEL